MKIRGEARRLIGEFFDLRPSGRLVTVGGITPEQSSRTVLLEAPDWQGMRLKPRARFHTALKATRPRSEVFQVAGGAPGHPPSGQFLAQCPVRQAAVLVASPLT